MVAGPGLAAGGMGLKRSLSSEDVKRLSAVMAAEAAAGGEAPQDGPGKKEKEKGLLSKLSFNIRSASRDKTDQQMPPSPSVSRHQPIDDSSQSPSSIAAAAAVIGGSNIGGSSGELEETPAWKLKSAFKKLSSKSKLKADGTPSSSTASVAEVRDRGGKGSPTNSSPSTSTSSNRMAATMSRPDSTSFNTVRVYFDPISIGPSPPIKELASLPYKTLRLSDSAQELIAEFMRKLLASTDLPQREKDRLVAMLGTFRLRYLDPASLLIKLVEPSTRLLPTTTVYHFGPTDSPYGTALLKFFFTDPEEPHPRGLQSLPAEFECLSRDHPETFTPAVCHDLAAFWGAHPGHLQYDLWSIRTVIACLRDIIEAGKERAGQDFGSVVITPSQQLFMLKFGERFISWLKAPSHRYPILYFGALTVIQDLASSRLWKRLGEKVRAKFIIFTDLTPQLSDIQVTFSTLLGVGSFGSVFKMKYKGHDVAVKQMKDFDMDMVAREVTVQTLISHPNLVVLHGVFSSGNPEAIHLVTEYADSGDLLSFFNHNRGNISDTLKISFARDISEGLAFLHSFGIVHRDLKSENILVFGNKIAKIADFGLARTSTAAFSRTLVAGSFLYQAPELVLAQKKATGGIKFAQAQVETSSDIYSLGYILWELASEQRVYSDIAQLEVMHSKMKDATGTSKIRRLVGAADRLPLPLPESRWDHLIKAAWAYKPDSRPTATSIQFSFEGLLGSN